MIALLRRLRPAPTPSDPALPIVWMGDDGEEYWADGHVEPHRMVFAAVVEHLLDIGSEETCELLFGVDLLLARAGWSDSKKHAGELVAGVEHLWIDRDAADNERLVIVTASHDRAMPVTRMRCW